MPHSAHSGKTGVSTAGPMSSSREPSTMGSGRPSTTLNAMSRRRKSPGFVQRYMLRWTQAVIHLMLTPWRLALALVSWWAGRLLSVLCYMGCCPSGFTPSSKYLELNKIVEHLHAREDGYRTQLRVLQDQLDASLMDRKKALRKLKGSLVRQTELESFAQLAADGRAPPPEAVEQLEFETGMPLQPHSPSKLGLHVSVAVLAVSVWWFYAQDHHAIQRKIIFAVLFPLAWAYLAAVGSRRPHLGILYAACWFLTGFVAAHRLSGVHCIPG